MERKKKNKKKLDVDDIEEKMKDIVDDLDLSDIDAIEVPGSVKERLESADTSDIEDIEKELGIEEEKLPDEVSDYEETEYQESENIEEERVNVDGSFTLSLKEDLMSVTIDLYPSHGDGQPLTVESVKDKLKSLEVVFGINYELLEKLVKKVEESKSEKKDIIIARGQPPKEGKNGWIEYKFGDSEDILLREKE
jgi:uncharacterized protein (DUF342 family)